MLYPHHIGLGGSGGIQAEFNITGHETLLRTASIDVATAKDADVILRLRELIVEGPFVEQKTQQ